MKKIDEISKLNIDKNYVRNILFLMTIIFTFAFISTYININNFDLSILTLPIWVIITLIMNEVIHIILFKAFGKKQAIIEIKRDKDLGAIIVLQKNKEVFYSKIESITILLSPLILITIATLVIIPFYPESGELLKINMLLNIMGSLTDIVTSYILARHKKDIFINYEFSKEKGVFLNIFEK